ncbi:MAG: lipopolysaccharide heptosyltransferase II [candidate division FCPU426 bacterium]
MKSALMGWGRRWFSRKPARDLTGFEPRRILVVKLCCLGDILFATPVVRALKARYPGARIGYLVTAYCRDLVAADPRVDDIIEFNAYDPGTLPAKLLRAWPVVRKLRQQRFDLAVVLHRSPLAGLMAAASAIPVRLGFDWQGEGFSLTHPVLFRPEAHEIDRNLDCLRPLGLEVRDTATELVPSPAADAAAETFLAQAGAGDQSRPLIAVFPAGGVNPGTVMVTKRWPVEGYREVCARLSRRFGARLVLVGSRDDAAVGDELAAGLGPDAPLLRAEGKTTLMVLAALLRRCDLFIGGDSGPLHMAAAVGTPTVSLFGPTDPRLLAPRGAAHRVLFKSPECAPCYNPLTIRQGQAVACRQGNLVCLRSLTPEMVLEAAGELLAQKGFEPR